MLKSLVLFILLLAPAAFAGEAFVTCRQVAWRYLADQNVYSLKTSSCVRIRTNFFETVDGKTRSYCESWSKEAGVGEEIYSIQSFRDQISCVQNDNEFRQRELGPVRPVEKTDLVGTEYLWFQDSDKPYFDVDVNRERARWAKIDDEWYCGLPGQKFYARYDFQNGNKDVYVSGLSLNTQKFIWQTSVGGTVFWRNPDGHSPFVYLESSVNIEGLNTFTFKDKDGNTISEFRLTYLIDVFRDPLKSCY
ncbi:hypothetical protein [Bdellovibrio sp. HCB2-146]|uniref:hypothetical protein n=1 Tax=Bdellovibrio sp. HCB2-146 TaxID=3394362 RepID=UPI0039BD7B8C